MAGEQVAYRSAEVVCVLQDLVKLLQVPDDHIPVALQDGERDKEVELVRVVVGPNDLPEPDDLREGKLPLERNEDPAEAEEEVERAGPVWLSADDLWL